MTQSDQSDSGPIASAVRGLTDDVTRSELLHWLPWRSEAGDVYADDVRIGRMLSSKIAEEAVMAHNVSLRKVDR